MITVNNTRKIHQRWKLKWNLQTVLGIFFATYAIHFFLHAATFLTLYAEVAVETDLKIDNDLAIVSNTQTMAKSLKKYYKEHFNYHPPIPKELKDDSPQQNDLCGSGPDYIAFFSLEKKSRRTKEDDDKIIYETFFKSSNMDSVNASNTYVEVGALDGIEVTKSRFYESCLGWEGLLIEGNPAPDAYGKLIHNRPHTHRMNFVPVCNFHEEMVKHKAIRFHKESWSFIDDRVREKDAEGKEDDYKEEVVVNHDGSIDNDTVPCGSLTHVLRDIFPNGRVTLFSLDMLGFEQLVLEKLEFEKVFIEIIVVKYQKMDDYSRKRCSEILYMAGYEQFTGIIEKSNVFIHKKSTTFLTKASDAGWKREGVLAQVQIVDKSRIRYYRENYDYHFPPGVLQESQLKYELCGSGPQYDKFFSLTKTLQRSTSNEDKTIYNVLFETTIPGSEEPSNRGTYVEVGAFDGIQGSNSRFYDSCLGWEGLLIENSSPEVYGKLIKKRPYTHRMNFIPNCDVEIESGQRKTIRFDDKNLPTSGIVEDGDKHDVNERLGGGTIDVPCGSLNQVLRDMFHGGKINFFSLDMVGSANLVLEKLDFATLSIEILLVNYHKEDMMSRTKSSLLQNAGYALFNNVIEGSDLYIHKGSTDLITKAIMAGWKTPPILNLDTGKELTSTTTTQLSDVRIIDYYKEHFNYYPPTTLPRDSQLQNNLCGSAPQYNKFFSLEKRLNRAKEDEDKILYQTFFQSDESIKNPTYVEAGAFDGIEAANSRFFDACLGWEGLLVEGNPSKKVYGNLIHNRPYAHRMNFVPICDSEEEEVKHKTVAFYNVRFPNAGIAEGGRVKISAYEGSDTVDVPCGSLQKALGHVLNGRVTLFSLDVVGSEDLVLEKLNLNSVFIEIFVVNFQRNNDDARKLCSEILLRAGYQKFEGKIMKSDVFIHRNSWTFLMKAKQAGW